MGSHKIIVVVGRGGLGGLLLWLVLELVLYLFGVYEGCAPEDVLGLLWRFNLLSALVFLLFFLVLELLSLLGLLQPFLLLLLLLGQHLLVLPLLLHDVELLLDAHQVLPLHVRVQLEDQLVHELKQGALFNALAFLILGLIVQSLSH